MAVLETVETRRRIVPSATIRQQSRPATAPVVAPPIAAPPVVSLGERPVEIPDYLKEVYTWAYIDPVNVRLLDHNWVVNTVLWGNKDQLQRVLFDELKPGRHVLQACCVYGDLSPKLARFLGASGRLEVIDVSPAQIESCRKKLRGIPQASVRTADAARPGGGPYDDVISFFLLHEMPDDYKHAVVNALLDSLAPGGKATFIDYHKPHPLHPLKWITALIFTLLEPFAMSLWHREIRDLATHAERFAWRTETYFGGLFQKTVAERQA